MQKYFSKRRKSTISIFEKDSLTDSVGYNIDMLNDELLIRQSFGARLAELRIKQNKSAREMSLGLGQGQGYISSIENGHVLPSMLMLFEICRYLDISPREFFEYTENDTDIRFEEHLQEKYRKLDAEKRRLVRKIIKEMER